MQSKVYLHVLDAIGENGNHLSSVKKLVLVK